MFILVTGDDRKKTGNVLISPYKTYFKSELNSSAPKWLQARAIC